MANQTLKDLENSGLYSKDLIDGLKSKSYSGLKNLSSEQKSSSKYMYPLLWAVKEELGTCIVYSYMSEELQSDTDITSEVIKSEPDLFKESPLSSDRNFILAHIKSIPNIAAYMSAALKTDLIFIKTLCEATSPDLSKQIMNDVGIHDPAILENVPSYNDLVVDAVVLAAIVANPQSVTELSEEQRNDYGTLKVAAMKNESIIDNVVENIDIFGSEGLRGIREANEDIIISKYTDAIKKSENTGGIKNLDKLIDLDNPDKEEDPGTVAKLLAVGFLTDSISPDLAKKAVNMAVLTLQRAKDDPEWLKQNPDAYKAIADPSIIEKCAEILKEHDITLTPQILEALPNYRKLHESLERPDFRTQEEIDEDELADRLEAEAEEAGMTLEEYMKENGIEPPPLYDEREEEVPQEENSEPTLGEERTLPIEEIKEVADSAIYSEVQDLTKMAKEDISKEITPEPKIEESQTEEEI